jgi:hypothetical protein
LRPKAESDEEGGPEAGASNSQSDMEFLSAGLDRWSSDEALERTRLTLTDRWSPHTRNILASTSYDMTCRS